MWVHTGAASDFEQKFTFKFESTSTLHKNFIIKDEIS